MMRDLITGLIAGVIGLGAGAVIMYFMTPVQETPTPVAADVVAEQEGADAGGDPLEGAGTEPDGMGKEADLQRLLDEANTRLDEAQRENENLEKEKTDLEKENNELETKVDGLETELKAVKDAAVNPETPRLPIDFGKWSEIEGLRDADWTELGGTYSKMMALMVELQAQIRKGETPDPEKQGQVQKLNQKLIDHYVKFYNQLPSNIANNGSFTHPANLVNILSGQLEEAGMPLTETQIADLTALGEQYDKKWEELQASYDDSTWELQKVVDEGELKEWFHDEMFKVATPAQKAVALPPELEGYIRMDLYSAGLVLMFHFDTLRVTDVQNVKPQLKDAIEQHLGMDRTNIDNAEWIFDEWVTALNAQLQPQNPNDADLMRTWGVIKAGKAQLAAMRKLADGYVVSDDIKKNFQNVSTIVFPQVVSGE